MWSVFFSFPMHVGFWCAFFWFLVILRLNVYGLLFVGFRRMSKYAFLGRMRACAQRIRYEVRFALVIFSGVISFGRRDL